MKVVSIGNRKGGTAKSTTAGNLAAAFTTLGWRVALIDIDPQRSLAEWHARRDATWPKLVELRPVDLRNWLLTAGAAFDLVLIDTPGHDVRALANAAALSDLVLIVSQPTTMANAATAAVRNACRQVGVPYAVLLSHTPPSLNSRLSAWVREYSRFGEVVDGFFAYRVDYQDAPLYGLGVTEYRPSGAAAAEVMRVCDWLITRLEHR